MRLGDRLKLSFNVLTKGIEGAYRGQAYGIGEQFNSYPLSSIEDGWQRNLAVQSQTPNVDAFACANLYATALAGVGMQHIKKKKDGSIEVMKDTPASRFCRYPNEYQKSSDFFLTYIIRLMLTGNSLAFAHYDERYAIDAVHLMPSHTPRYGVDDQSNYYYDISGNPLVPFEELMARNYIVPAREVAHARLYCPRHPLEGVSPLTFAGVSGGLGNLIRGTANSFFNNESRPSGVLSTEMNLTKEQMEKLRAFWNEQTTGRNIGGTPILSNGLKWNQVTMSATDAELIATLKLTSIDIAKVFGVPSVLIGIDASATQSSTESLINQWRALGLNFVSQHIESTFERLFRLPADQELRFDLDNLARTDFMTKVDALTKSIQQGLMSPNEARAKIDLASVEYGNEPRVQAQVVPLSQVAMSQSMASAPSANEPKPATDPKQDPEQDQQAEDIKKMKKKLKKLEQAEDAPVWTEGQIYREGDIVSHYLGQKFKALADTISEPMGTDGTDWTRVGSSGFRLTGGFSEEKTYEIGDIYFKEGSSYCVDKSGHRLFAKGITKKDSE
jgi:HK97 family phage portal protein